MRLPTTPIGDGAPIVQYWDRERPPGYVAELLASFGRLNPGRRHLVFNEATGERFIAEHYGEREVAPFRACAVPAMQADYLRYCAILKLGGVYADADLRCAGDVSGLFAGSGQGSLFWGGGMNVNGFEGIQVLNGLFAFERPGHPLLRLAVDLATAGIERRIHESVPGGLTPDQGVWLVTGPGVFSNLYLVDRMGSFDTLRRFTAGTPAEPVARMLHQVIRDFARLREAFESVSFAPFADVGCVEEPSSRELPYRATEVHWMHWKGPILRGRDGS